MVAGLRFDGISSELIKVLMGGESAPQPRYLALMDYVQYNNPPYLQSEMESELGIPQPSISRFFAVLSEKAKVRFRLDFITRKIGLRAVAVVYNSKWPKSLPAIDWISSINHANEGTIIFYRVPEGNVEDLYDLLVGRAGEPDVFMQLDDFVYAKPSMKHYFIDVEQMDPIVAYRYAQSHPAVDVRYLLPYRGHTTNVLRDIVDLSILLYGEINSVYSHVRAWGTLSESTHQRAKKKILYHINHVQEALRGSKALIYDNSDAMTLTYVLVNSDSSCVATLPRTLLIYLYTIGVSFSTDNSILALMALPARYVPSTVSLIFGECGKSISVYTQSVHNVALRQFLPVRNFSVRRRTWVFEEAPLLEMMKRKSDRLVVDTDYAYDIDEERYLEELRSSMGEEYVNELFAEDKILFENEQKDPY